ncbi:ABC transporter permease [Rhodocytophaga rosea]|uniref:ABC transporter permease n=1 Tax=Rhodocytophaga rosea TaxID=2704465 RepID=A0A6C0GRA9_9BACT|nr:ABC transporter permease [Rhodocytophaga rosea]QHT70092.1 ABC transporter permease [Rhodocytophaga rosea]
MLFLQLTFESFRFAWHALKSNLTRTILSLLGVTVGIFAIIAVFTIIDSLEKNIRDSMAFLGDKVIYVQKFPWVFGPNYPWWKYVNRPMPNVREFRFLERNLENRQGVAIFDFKSNVTFRSGNNSIEGSNVQGVSYDYSIVSEVPIEEGRYFSIQEVDAAREVAVIGFNIAESLFPNTDPIGKTFKIKGLPFKVIAVMEKQGSSIMGGPDYDNTSLIPYGAFSKMYTTRWSQPLIAVKGLETDEGLMELESEITGLMRSRRGLKPTQEDNFALNRPEMAGNAITSVFGVINFAGGFISFFSILVGGFGIANIMFVSVKERTNIIGIQKSLGAKNYFILFQFLFEAVFLCLLGGGVGILIVYLLTFIPLGSLEVILSFKNIMIGLGLSSIIGVLAGIIPAFVAARLDPVIAIRSK